eukprot:gb/GEZJ01006745.1/.p1 GENE.gb/GEZJ01006745.1/~~gb/GEZJ01006745.1/.p1  ORF type:complete len:100 (-),score=12.23 gb/GEZJ01006745.1/:218-517(-)
MHCAQCGQRFRETRDFSVRGSMIWQTDGRPMSGDIGGVAAISSVKLAQRENIPGHVQLAGGTNASTVARMRKAELLRLSNEDQTIKIPLPAASGIAVGG